VIILINVSNQFYERIMGGFLLSPPPFCPYRYKYELVDWAMNRFKMKKSKANSMSKKQLYAIWFNQ